MTTRKKTATGRTKVKKLELKKETIRDLDVKGSGKRIKGGRANADTEYYCSAHCYNTEDPDLCKYPK